MISIVCERVLQASFGFSVRRRTEDAGRQWSGGVVEYVVDVVDEVETKHRSPPRIESLFIDISSRIANASGRKLLTLHE